jgi:hypothetical protein
MRGKASLLKERECRMASSRVEIQSRMRKWEGERGK